ncbi:hypothetical protein BK131_04485 [Paenibacillus amylolyticus]|uniref:Uncharacterized protein n=2 Tax=Paenibacillus amylolyticus TaxID=1451 RepID=A0A1R1C5A7_PAEAM|nr:hypothetical protein BK131_04485 [Paenibacillus amylolyticus]
MTMIRNINGKFVSKTNPLAVDVPISAEEGVYGEDVATFGPSTTHGYDPGTGSIRMMYFARRTWEQQFFKAQAVPAGNSTIVTSSENIAVPNFSKIRLFAKASGTGNIDLVLRVSVNGGYDYENVQTFPMGADAKTIMSPIIELGATHIKIGLFNKSAATQNVDVWGFLH